MKKILLAALAVFIVLILSAISYVKLALPNVGDPEEITIEITPERVERGDYLANKVALCMDCHSTRDWTTYAAPPISGTEGIGGERFDQNMGFPGVYYSRNITPYRLKDWTDGEIFRAITTGVSRDGSALFPVMPYANYRIMDREDIYSIIAYLRNLEPVPSEAIPSVADFPMSVIINTIPQPADLQSIPDKSDKEAYGKYLLTTASCHECHTQAEQGNLLMDLYLAGGRDFVAPWGTIRSANLTSDKKTGIGNWTEEQFVARFKMHTDSAYVAPKVDLEKGEFQTIMPWLMYANMETYDLQAIYAYLNTIDPIENQVIKWSPAD